MSAETPTPIHPWATPARRLWLYRVATAVVPLLVAYGVLGEQEQALWLALATSVFGTATASAHTPRD
jgi:hypothetical protein